MKKIIMSAVAVFLAGCGQNEPAPQIEEATLVTPQDEIVQIADDYLAGFVEHYPFAIIFSGLSERVTISDDAFPDNSPEGLAAFHALEDDLAERLTDLDGHEWSNTSDFVLYETLREAITANIGLRVCYRPWWGVNHMSGWQNGFARIAEAQPFETVPQRMAALSRWSQLPGYIAQEQVWLEEGMLNNYSAPKRVVARVVAQLDNLIEGGAENLPFVAFANGINDPEFRAEVGRLAADDMLPAIQAYRDFLRDVYLPKARDDLSISALPDGEACYEALLRDYHSVAIGSADTFARGFKTVEANKQGVVERGEAMFGLSQFADILERVKTDPENRFTSEEALIEYTRDLIPESREKVSAFFNALPAQDVIVEPFPDYLKGTGQSSRYEQKPLKEGPGIYRINTDNWAIDTRGGAEITAAHEGWPGHHLQIATSHTLSDRHPILSLLRSTAFVEGWARYSEALAEEAGIYESGYGQITRRAWPARGMVVDPGLHVQGWTIDEAVAFLMESGRFDEESANRMLDRIAAIPGQLTAYDTGGLEIFALRAEAADRLGDDFDIREFHDRVLENGALPVSALRSHVQNWIDAEAAN